ncbi:MAG: S-formylglutathione hydrolase [Pseudomonadota bacterium]
MEIVSETRLFGGRQITVQHDSAATGTPMRVAVFLPDVAGDCPAVVYLSGLTCTEDNVTQKAGAQRIAAELGMVFVAPDTSPRGDGVADDEAYDLGQGAGFYVNASEAPWAPHFRMYDYVTQDLMALIGAEFPVDMNRVGITGHSMGGHGALTIGLRHPELFKSISAFSPIVSPLNCPWGEKAMSAYLGNDRAIWAEHDACALIKARGWAGEILVDQGDADGFLEEQLKTHLFEEACTEAGVSAHFRMQPGYDHSYFFIATFIEDHLRHHHRILAGTQ